MTHRHVQTPDTAPVQPADVPRTPKMPFAPSTSPSGEPIPGPGPSRGTVLQVEGVVISGDQRGRLLGFPTANVAVPGHHWRDGVWAGTVQIDPAANGPVHLAAV